MEASLCVSGLDLAMSGGFKTLRVCHGLQTCLSLNRDMHCMEPCDHRTCHTLLCVSSLSQGHSWLEFLNSPLKCGDVRVVGVPSHLSSPCFIPAPPQHCPVGDWVTAALVPVPDCPASNQASMLNGCLSQGRVGDRACRQWPLLSRTRPPSPSNRHGFLPGSLQELLLSLHWMPDCARQGHLSALPR